MAVRNILSTLTLGALSAAALFASGIIFASNSETVVRDSFSIALSGAPAVTPARTVKSVPVAGTEEYWLTSMGRDGGLPITKTVAIGDQIGLTVRGEQRQLKVCSVSEFSPEITEIDTRTAPSRLVLVTARDTSDKDARPVRFVMEIDQDVHGIAAQTARTL